MERDFLGLNRKEPLPVVKEEFISDGCKEIGYSKGSRILWPFSNKVSTFPHLNSLNVVQEEKTKRVVSDSLMSPGFLSISTSDAFEPTQKQFMAEFQKSSNHKKQGGSHFALTAYPVQQDVNSVHHLHDVRLCPVSDSATPISMGNPFFKNYYATAGQNVAGTTTKSQLLGGIPVTTPQTILPAVGSVAGMTESCVKASGSPAQLSIFYAGTVNVYDDISPEKAQAIMLLAGNGSSISSNTAQPKIQGQVPSSKALATCVSPVSQPVTKPPCPRISSPLSVSSHTGAQSGSGSTSTEEILAAKNTRIATTSVSKPDSPRIASVIGSVAATTMIPSVPQARKASLARFLEKRKERVMSAAPYNLSKKYSEFSIKNPAD